MDTRVPLASEHRRAYVLLALLLLGITGAVATIALLTRERIRTNEAAWYIARLEALAKRLQVLLPRRDHLDPGHATFAIHRAADDQDVVA